VTDSHHTSELPKGWAWTELKEIAIEINSGFPSGRWKRGAENGVLHLRPMNIDTKGKIELTDVKYVQAEGYDALSKGDVIFNNTNSPELLGKTACIREDTNWAYSNHMTRIRFFPSLMEPAFIGHYLHFLFRNGYFKTRCVHHVNQASIGKDFLSKMHIPFPPSSEQKRIVTKLDELFACLDTGIEGLRKVKAQLKRYRQAVLKYAFEGKLTEEWRKTHRDQMEPTTRMLEQKEHQKKVKTEGDSTENPLIDTSTLPKLPESWVWTRLSDIAEKIVDGSHNPPPKQAMGIPMLSAQNILNNEIVFSKCRYISENDYREETGRALIEANDVLLTIVGTIGRSAVVKESMPKFAVQRSVAVIKSSVKAEYLSFQFQSPFYSSYFMKNAKGTAQKGIYLNQLEKLPIVLAPIPEQNLIVEEIESQFSLVDKLQEAMELSSKQSERLRQSILTAAFDGRLVPQDTSDEPAEKLLERIKAERAESKGENDMNRRKNKPRQLELSTYVK